MKKTVIRCLTAGEYEDFHSLGHYEFPSLIWLRKKLDSFRRLKQRGDRHYFGRHGFNGAEFVIWLGTKYPQQFIDQTPPAPPELHVDWDHLDSKMILEER